MIEDEKYDLQQPLWGKVVPSITSTNTTDPSECEILEELVIHDYREQGITMDWKRAEELCRKIREKDK